MARLVIQITWDDCPHLSPPYLSREKRDQFESSLLPHQREARKTGRPALGAGAIYQTAESDISVEPFEIPPHWWQGMGLDVGWNCTAGVRVAKDPDNDVMYVTGCYKEGHKEPHTHIHGLRGMEPWGKVQWACDPAAHASNQKDGSSLFDQYVDLGLNLRNAKNAVWGGITAITLRMQSGRFKVFSTLRPWWTEFRLYRTEKHENRTGERIEIVKKNDHLMDATRYAVFTPGVVNARPARADSYESFRYGEF